MENGLYRCKRCNRSSRRRRKSASYVYNNVRLVLLVLTSIFLRHRGFEEAILSFTIIAALHVRVSLTVEWNGKQRTSGSVGVLFRRGSVQAISTHQEQIQ